MIDLTKIVEAREIFRTTRQVLADAEQAASSLIWFAEYAGDGRAATNVFSAQVTMRASHTANVGVAQGFIALAITQLSPEILARAVDLAQSDFAAGLAVSK